jgi:hypothetical protein
MKRTLGPSWTAEQIAAGEQFKQGWLEFFSRLGAAAPVVPPGLDAEAGSRAAIRARHEARAACLSKRGGRYRRKEDA